MVVSIWQLRSSVKPPDQHGHVSANDKLDDKFARGDVRGILVGYCGKFLAHQIGRVDLVGSSWVDSFVF